MIVHFRSSRETLKSRYFSMKRKKEKKRYKNVIVRFQEANLLLVRVVKYYMQNLEIPTR